MTAAQIFMFCQQLIIMNADFLVNTRKEYHRNELAMLANTVAREYA